MPALSTNDTELEVDAVMSGHAIGLLSGFSVAPHIRAGRLLPLLAKHATKHLGVHVYYGSRTSQPARVRGFIDLAVDRVAHADRFVMSDRELAAGEAKARKIAGARSLPES
ncbi:LysR substrate-binding domain-containing protein [Rhizobacter sp. Root1221]|uniref:LysR substrate-binding domain-containing protein n=1 Tax=Rhizobacter sp. Root1221 TaxID=1736433 RepID=UPI0006F6A60F|nr:hypothetical protein ASC87_15455 [Rhizobacter sp. Root1221]